MTTVYRVPYSSAPTSSSAATQYAPIGEQYANLTATESSTQRRWPRASTFKNLLVYVSTNAAANTTTISFRIGGSSSSLTVPISAAATGWFEDASNSASVALNDDINFEILRTDAGAVAIERINVSELSSDVSIVAGAWVNSAQGLGTASATRYISSSGVAATINATETTNGIRSWIARAATASKMRINVTANARSTTTTFTSRVNGADGNQTIPITATSTGWFEDASNTDSLAAGDTFNYKIVTSTGLGTISFFPPICILTDATSTVNILANSSGNLNTNQTRFVSLGSGVLESTEANAEIKMRGTGTISKVNIDVTAASSNQDATYTVRKNGADTAITFTVTAGVTGQYGDNANSFTYADGDLICLKAVRAAGGSGSFTVEKMYWALTPDSETLGGATGSPYYYYHYMRENA